MAPRFPLARGWERQLDIKYNSLFYDHTLTPATYDAWLHKLAVRFVAVSDADLDYSAHEETALIDRGLPYLKLVFESRDWHVYAVQDPAPIAQGRSLPALVGAEFADACSQAPRHRPPPGPVHALLGAGQGIGLRGRRQRLHDTSVAPGGACDTCYKVLAARIRATSPRCN